jgi:hypothetical protein
MLEMSRAEPSREVGLDFPKSVPYAYQQDGIARTTFQEEDLMEQLPTQLLPAVTHFVFSIFNISLPNLIVVAVFIAIFILGAWARLPSFIEHGRSERKGSR